MKLCPYCGGPIIEAKFTLSEMQFPDPYCGRCGRNYPRKAEPIDIPAAAQAGKE